MKFIGKISLFLLMAVPVFVAGAYANSMYLHWFYPNKVEIKEFVPFEMEDNKEETQPAVPAAGTKPDVVTCDTAFVIEEYDMDEETSVTREDIIPGKYIGMDREEFIEAMGFYELSPPLAEQERGFVSLEVLSFSKDKITLRKNYRTEPEAEENDLFYLVCENNYITVYKEDLQTVYMYTDISVEGLPEALQEEIIQKKVVNSEGELYNFLESYSS